MNIDIALCDLSRPHGNHSRRTVGTDETVANRQRASFLSELQTKIRLRSPHTVNVYGAITSQRDRLVLVMELLTGGDLFSFLKHAEARLPQARARQIIEDVCAGMAFLHGKNAVHGDLKSPNILLDGEGRAKVRQPRVRRLSISSQGWCRLRRASLRGKPGPAAIFSSISSTIRK